MAFNLDDDVVAMVLEEETLGIGPRLETLHVPEEFRLRVRREVEAIKRAGGVIHIPGTHPSGEET